MSQNALELFVSIKCGAQTPTLLSHVVNQGTQKRCFCFCKTWLGHLLRHLWFRSLLALGGVVGVLCFGLRRLLSHWKDRQEWRWEGKEDSRESSQPIYMYCETVIDLRLEIIYYWTCGNENINRAFLYIRASHAGIRHTRHDKTRHDKTRQDKTRQD